MITTAQDRLFALVPCAGVGSRSGASLPKQYVELARRPAVAHTLRALEAVQALTAIMVVLSPDDQQFESLVPEFQGPRSWVARCGVGVYATPSRSVPPLPHPTRQTVPPYTPLTPRRSVVSQRGRPRPAMVHPWP